jgi:hypothetical protein
MCRVRVILSAGFIAPCFRQKPSARALQARARRNRLEAEGLALSQWPIAGEEPGPCGREDRKKKIGAAGDLGATASEAARFADLIESRPLERRRVAALGPARLA